MYREAVVRPTALKVARAAHEFLSTTRVPVRILVKWQDLGAEVFSRATGWLKHFLRELFCEC